MRRGGTRAARAAWLSVLLALYGASALDAAPAPFLWHVQGRVATSYLVGAVHLLPSSADSLPAALEQAYDETDGAIFETDLGALQTRAVQLRFMAAGQAVTELKNRVSPRLYARVAHQMQALGVPPALCGRVRAWWCAVSLGIYQFARAGFSEEYGIDNHFYGEAVADGKTVQWFETPAAHLALFSGMDRRLGRALLRAAVAPDASGLASPQAVYRAWRDDDVAAVAGFDSRFKQRYPALYARLIADRNRAWMPKLQALLDGQDGQLIVVGAAHLVGPDGLVGALRAAGYRVAPGLAATGHELRTRWLTRGRP